MLLLVRRCRRTSPVPLWLVLAAASAVGVAACSGAGPGGVPAASPRAEGSSAPATGGPSRPGTGASSPAHPATSPAAAGGPLAGQVVVLDPGHNGANWDHPAIINRLVNAITERKPCDTTGTQTDSGYTEHAFSFDVATRLAGILRAEGARVILTRRNDHGVGPCITERARIGNQAHADAAISIHADGGPPGGIGFVVLEPGLVPGYTNRIIGPSARLGMDIRDSYHRITGEQYSSYTGQDGIEVRTDLGGLNLSTVPKVFIECGNMRNAADAARLTSPSFRQLIAKALAAGLTAFLTRPKA